MFTDCVDKVRLTPAEKAYIAAHLADWQSEPEGDYWTDNGRMNVTLTTFATEEWPGPGYPVNWEAATKFTDRESAKQLLVECEKKGWSGHIAVMEIRIKSR